jgi:hypothetical protein
MTRQEEKNLLPDRGVKFLLNYPILGSATLALALLIVALLQFIVLCLINGYARTADTSYKVEESKKFTVAPAYNKSGYQVISEENIKDIGR